MAPAAAITILLIGGLRDMPELRAQTSIIRKVVGGGGGTTASSGHIIRGTFSQTAVGRMIHNGSDRHDVGFWYWAYQPEVIARVSIPHVDAEAGTRLTIPMTLTVDETRKPFLPRAFRARVRFNRTLLHQTGATPPCDPGVDGCVIEINGVANADGTIAEMEFVTALGDSEATPLAFEEFEWEQKGEERIATAKDDGEMRLLGVCREGGQIRLIRSGAFASRIRVWPNPATDHAMVEYVAAESGTISIRLVDLYGNEVARLLESDVEAQRLYQAEIDLDAVPSGSYTVVYSTPTQTTTQRLLITQ
jgi:hypothetical protein